MALVVPDVGETLMLEHIVGKTAVENLVLKLYKSNTTPGESDTAGTYTEADFTGYSAVTLTGSSWSAASGTASYAQQSFTSSANQSAQTIYGYFVVGASSGTLYWAERFSSSQTIQNNNDVIRVTPQLTAS